MTPDERHNLNGGGSQRRPFQFRLLTLIVVMSLFAVLFAISRWIGWWLPLFVIPIVLGAAGGIAVAYRRKANWQDQRVFSAAVGGTVGAASTGLVVSLLAGVPIPLAPFTCCCLTIPGFVGGFFIGAFYELHRRHGWRGIAEIVIIVVVCIALHVLAFFILAALSESLI